MKLFRFIMAFMSLIFQSVWKFSRDYVIPVIDFINVIKQMLEMEVDVAKCLLNKKAFEYDSFFIEYLNCAESIIYKIMRAFIESVKVLVPDIEETKWNEILLALVVYIKDLSKHQKAYLYFKLASLMVLKLAPDKYELHSNHSDFLVQFNYTYRKNKKRQ
ncbi:MAG: hypothetical protein KAT68_00650 [Bacteroidales bacterium]|nr:hypothetical protein [Bacteroidales bacterium]